MKRPGTLSKNTFAPSEWAGAMGDLGILLPLAFALVVFNGYSPHRLFFLWGLVYIASGWYFRVPVSVQPLKAMTVIAIIAGYQVNQLASTAFFYGVLLILLSSTGIIRILERWFTSALIRGIQLGIGLILFHKAVTMIGDSGLYIWQESTLPWINLGYTLLAVLVLGVIQFRWKILMTLPIILVSIIVSIAYGVQLSQSLNVGSLVDIQLPDPGFLVPAILYLMIPQLPLTLGNAVYAASDTCRTYWPDRTARIHPTRFGLSIGISNVLVGLGGGFPVCHGAGGIAAHARFGGKTGGTSIIIGGLLVAIAILKPLANLLFYIPVPILGALLIFTSWELMILTRRLSDKSEIITALIVGSVSFVTRNLAIALLAGIVIEHGMNFAQNRIPVTRSENP